MEEWMNRLAAHHRRMRQTHPHGALAVVFDIDDTILYFRHMILHVLRAFDQSNDSDYFEGFEAEDMAVNEEGLFVMLRTLRIPRHERLRIMQWLRRYAWSSHVIRFSHRPFPGVMEVLRWIQSQRNTCVALNTGRPEIIRSDTLQCLCGIGRSFGVSFSDDLLYMSRYAWGERIAASKREGIEHFSQKGYHVIAFIDNEPENLFAVAELDISRDVLLLHADMVYSGVNRIIPPQAVRGNAYNAQELLHPTNTNKGFEKAAA